MKSLNSFFLTIFFPLLSFATETIEPKTSKLVAMFSEGLDFLSDEKFIQNYLYFVLIISFLGIFQFFFKMKNKTKNFFIFLFNFVLSFILISQLNLIKNNQNAIVSVYSKAIDLNFASNHFKEVESIIENRTNCKIKNTSFDEAQSCLAKFNKDTSPEFFNIFWVMKIVYFIYLAFFGFFSLAISILIFLGIGFLLISVPITQVSSLREKINKYVVKPLIIRYMGLIIFMVAIMLGLSNFLTHTVSSEYFFKDQNIDLRNLILNYYLFMFVLMIIAQSLLAQSPKIVNGIYFKIRNLFKKEKMIEERFSVNRENFNTKVKELKLKKVKVSEGSSISFFDIPLAIIKKYSHKYKRLSFEFVYTTQENLKKGDKHYLIDDSVLRFSYGKNSRKVYLIEIDDVLSHEIEDHEKEILFFIEKQIALFQEENEEKYLSTNLNLLTLRNILKTLPFLTLK